MPDGPFTTRRLATTLAGLAFVWTMGATVYLPPASTPLGLTTGAMLSATGGATGGLAPPPASGDGVWMVALLGLLTATAAVPLGVAMRYPPGLRPTAWSVALALVPVCLLGGFTVGLFYLPAVVLLVLAGVMADPPAAQVRGPATTSSPDY